MKAFLALLSSLPELLKLIREIQARIKEEQLTGKVKDNVANISEAFKSKDASKLNDIFKSK